MPDRGAGDDAPFRSSCRHAVPGTSLTRRLSTQRIRPRGLNATSQARSQPCACAWSERWSKLCRDAPTQHRADGDTHDAVRLAQRNPPPRPLNGGLRYANPPYTTAKETAPAPGLRRWSRCLAFQFHVYADLTRKGGLRSTPKTALI